jgi:2'-5' RNA ligase
MEQTVYFIGIALPNSLNQQIATLKWKLYDHDDTMLKPILPHVTLLHPPALQGIMPSELIPKVHEVAKRYIPFTIALTEIGFFGKNVCFIKAEAMSLYSFQSQLVRLLPPDVQSLHYKRQYLPHVTLAQIYEPHTLDKKKLTKTISHHISLPLSFQVDSVTYFKRILPREYQPETI